MTRTVVLMLVAGAGLLAGGVVAYVVTPLTSRLAGRLGIVDVPDDDPVGRKLHSAPVPYLGGVAIFVGLLIGAGGPGLYAALVSDTPTGPILGVFGLASIVMIIGLIDDARHLSLSPRLLVELVAAVGAWSLGFQVLATPWTALNVFITVAWIVGITNAFNLLDNMDGLTAGLAAVGAMSFATMGVVEHLAVLAVVSAALGGSCLGFLGHNRHPAKCFMGDSGSLLIGFLLALIGIKLRFDNLVEVTFLVPVVVLGLPIFDTTLVVLSRLKKGISPLSGGRDHVSHRLVAIGLPVKTAVALLYWCGICLGWLGLVVSRSNVQVGWMLLGFVIALGAFFGILLWQVPVREGPKEAITSDESLPISVSG